MIGLAGRYEEEKSGKGRLFSSDKVMITCLLPGVMSQCPSNGVFKSPSLLTIALGLLCSRS